MVTRIGSAFVLICLVSGMSFAADDPFCGKWKMNVSKSKITGERMKIDEVGNQKLRFDDGSKSDTITVDGTDQPLQRGGTMALTKLGPNSMRMVIKVNGNVVSSMVHRISDDGQIQTIEGPGPVQMERSRSSKWRRSAWAADRAGREHGAGVIFPTADTQNMVSVLKIVAPISLISLLVLGGCTDSSGAAQTSGGSGAIGRAAEKSAVPVVISKVERSSFPVELRAIGTGQAFKTVSVESQVAGIVKEVHYRQGQLIHQGDLLITLDKSPFLAALAQAEAALARDKAQAQLSQAELQRSSELDKQGIISKQQYQQSLATSTAMQATVQADEAAIQTEKIQLSYCSIYAPISGVAGAQLVYPGATVKANDLPVLVVINQVSPIYVDFAVPQQYLGSIKTFMARSPLGVEATPPGGSVAEKGVLTFVNNTVDTTTGTIHLLASFPNTDQRLWPGQYSNVLLRLNKEQNVLVIPSQAVQTGQQGDYVFVTKPDMTVAVRQVKVGRTVNNQTQILQGLADGETVVIDGQVRLVPGTKVYLTKGL